MQKDSTLRSMWMPSEDIVGEMDNIVEMMVNESVKDEVTEDTDLSRFGMPIVRAAVMAGLGSVNVPMRMASKMSALVNDKHALKAFLDDKTSAGNWVSQKFLDTYMAPNPAIEPEDFDVCPILLTQPAEDHWSPQHLSTPFLSRVKKVSVETVLLQNAGHYPIEEPGLTQMHDAIVKSINKNI